MNIGTRFGKSLPSIGTMSREKPRTCLRLRLSEIETIRPSARPPTKKDRPHIEDRAQTIEAEKPWRKLGMSRRTWCRLQTEQLEGPMTRSKGTGPNADRRIASYAGASRSWPSQTAIGEHVQKLRELGVADYCSMQLCGRCCGRRGPQARTRSGAARDARSPRACAPGLAIAASGDRPKRRKFPDRTSPRRVVCRCGGLQPARIPTNCLRSPGSENT